METTVIREGSRLTCSACASTQVVGVCHHCGKPLCAEHLLIGVKKSGMKVNREFSGINLEGWPLNSAEPIHCQECAHGMLNLSLISLLAGGAIMFIGLVAGNLVILILGIVVIFAGLLMNSRFFESALSRWIPDLPVGLVTDKIRVIETIKSSIRMDDRGRSVVSSQQAGQGEIETGFKFTPQDQERLEQYLRRYTTRNEANSWFSGGFLLLSGKPEITIDRPFRPNVIAITGCVADHPYLGQTGAPAPAQLPSNLVYTFRQKNHTGNDPVKPINLIPYIVESGNSRQIQVELQFSPRAFSGLQVGEDVTIESVQFWLDRAAFGRPITSGLVADDENRTAFRVEWRNLNFRIKTIEGIQRYTLPTIDVHQPISEGTHLTGLLRLRIPALASGIEEALYVSPLGHFVVDPRTGAAPFPCTEWTYLEIDFELAMDCVTQSRLYSADWQTTWQGAPDADLVYRIVSLLEADPASGLPSQNLHINRLVEEPQRLSDRDAEFRRNYWDISGRRYHQILPVDFHIVAYGDGNGERGVTNLEVIAKGQVFDSASRQAVDDTITEIRFLLEKSDR